MTKMWPRIQNSKLSLVKKIPMDAIRLLSARLQEVRLVNLRSKPSTKWAKQVLEPMSKLTVSYFDVKKCHHLNIIYFKKNCLLISRNFQKNNSCFLIFKNFVKLQHTWINFWEIFMKLLFLFNFLFSQTICWWSRWHWMFWNRQPDYCNSMWW